jgi:UDP-N-acetylmuramate dehydrogenase
MIYSKKTILSKLTELGIESENISIDEPMSSHTSFRVGGPADLMVRCDTRSGLAKVKGFLASEGIEHMLIGNGSNLLFADEGYRGVIIKLGKEFEEIKVDQNVVTSGSSVLLSKLSSVACENGLAGLEFASGIPGSVGGAVFMNAGAYGGEIKDVVYTVTLMSGDGTVSEKHHSEMDFSYRHSLVQDTGDIVLAASFILLVHDREEIAERVRVLTEKRNSKQPVNYPSAGSTFKRPKGGFAAAMIEQAGLKGVSIGGAAVSEKHAGFIINRGGATANDVVELIRLVRQRVYDNTGIMLEPEVRLIGITL